MLIVKIMVQLYMKNRICFILSYHKGRKLHFYACMQLWIPYCHNVAITCHTSQIYWNASLIMAVCFNLINKIFEAVLLLF